MPEIKVPIGGFDIFKIVGAVFALAVAWTTIDSKVQAQAIMMADHEARIRSMESLVLVEFGAMRGDMKSEFHGMKLRVTALEKAVEKVGEK